MTRMSDAAAVVAIDLGGTKLAAALVDSRGTIGAKLKLPVEKESPQKSIQQICEVAARIAPSWEQVRAIGVAVPGIYFAETGHAWAPNLWGWDQVPLRDALASRFPVPVVIDSDRAAYVLGEQWLGAARGLSEVVFLAVGTGIGAGIITNGQLCRGAGGIAGAVGWFALDPRKKEIYKQIGCFEAEAAGPAVARRAGASTAEAVVEAARQNDAAACRVLEETAAWLAMGVANIVSILNPQMIVLGGGLMQAGDLLLEPLRREVLEWAQPLAARQVRIEMTQLGEDAGLLGAARLALLKGT
jgi:glucokinase